MKKILLSLVCFVALFCLVDVISGGILDYLRGHLKSGEMRGLEYIAKQCDQDVLIFGSSRAKYHYNPEILADSLGMTCYNCGRDGMGILYCYGYWKMLSKRYIPKVILYDYALFDVEYDDYTAYLSPLMPYCDDKDVRQLISDVDSTEFIKSYSHLYRYNSTLLQLIKGVLVEAELGNGFEAKKGEVVRINKRNYDYKANPLKVTYLEKFVADVKSKGVKLVFFNSPFYDGANMTLPEEIAHIFETYGVDFYDNQDLEGYTANKKMFVDRTHLNEKGSTEYTKLVVGQLRKAR